MKKAIIYCLALLCTPAFPATLALTPDQYAPGGYSTIVWNGVAPCAKSSVPAYDVWNAEPGDSGGRSVAPQATTVFTLTCADGAVSRTLTVGSVVQIPAAGVAPGCYPDITLPIKVRTVAIPTLSNGDNRLSLWTCRTATGYKNERWSWKLSDVSPWVEQALSGVLDEAAARQWSIANAGGEDHGASAELDLFAATAKVAVNGTSLTRPVYPLNADGTRGTTAVAGVRATVGTPCDIGRRVAGTNYYAIPNTQTVTLCTFTAPAGVND